MAEENASQLPYEFHQNGAMGGEWEMGWLEPTGDTDERQRFAVRRTGTELYFYLDEHIMGITAIENGEVAPEAYEGVDIPPKIVSHLLAQASLPEALSPQNLHESYRDRNFIMMELHAAEGEQWVTGIVNSMPDDMGIAQEVPFYMNPANGKVYTLEIDGLPTGEISDPYICNAKTGERVDVFEREEVPAAIIQHWQKVTGAQKQPPTLEEDQVLLSKPDSELSIEELQRKDALIDAEIARAMGGSDEELDAFLKDAAAATEYSFTVNAVMKDKEGPSWELGTLYLPEDEPGTPDRRFSARQYGTDKVYSAEYTPEGELHESTFGKLSLSEVPQHIKDAVIYALPKPKKETEKAVVEESRTEDTPYPFHPAFHGLNMQRAGSVREDDGKWNISLLFDAENPRKPLSVAAVFVGNDKEAIRAYAFGSQEFDSDAPRPSVVNMETLDEVDELSGEIPQNILQAMYLCAQEYDLTPEAMASFQLDPDAQPSPLQDDAELMVDEEGNILSITGYHFEVTDVQDGWELGRINPKEDYNTEYFGTRKAGTDELFYLEYMDEGTALRARGGANLDDMPEAVFDKVVANTAPPPALDEHLLHEDYQGLKFTAKRFGAEPNNPSQQWMFGQLSAPGLPGYENDVIDVIVNITEPRAHAVELDYAANGKVNDIYLRDMQTGEPVEELEAEGLSENVLFTAGELFDIPAEVMALMVDEVPEYYGLSDEEWEATQQAQEEDYDFVFVPSDEPGANAIVDAGDWQLGAMMMKDPDEEVYRTGYPAARRDDGVVYYSEYVSERECSRYIMGTDSSDEIPEQVEIVVDELAASMYRAKHEIEPPQDDTPYVEFRGYLEEAHQEDTITEEGHEWSIGFLQDNPPTPNESGEEEGYFAVTVRRDDGVAFVYWPVIDANEEIGFVMRNWYTGEQLTEALVAIPEDVLQSADDAVDEELDIEDVAEFVNRQRAEADQIGAEKKPEPYSPYRGDGRFMPMPFEGNGLGEEEIELLSTPDEELDEEGRAMKAGLIDAHVDDVVQNEINDEGMEGAPALDLEMVDFFQRHYTSEVLRGRTASGDLYPRANRALEHLQPHYEAEASWYRGHGLVPTRGEGPHVSQLNAQERRALHEQEREATEGDNPGIGR